MSEPTTEASLREWAYREHAQLGFSEVQLWVQAALADLAALRDRSAPDARCEGAWCSIHGGSCPSLAAARPNTEAT